MQPSCWSSGDIQEEIHAWDLARGESNGSLRAPYPTDAEVAARVEAERSAKDGLPDAEADDWAPGPEDPAAETAAAVQGPEPPPE